MPVFVDHEERRRQVIAVASRLIAEAGLEAVTVRDVAEAAECSTAIVSHYFHNKRELLFLTYNSSIEVVQGRCDSVLARDPGDLRSYVAELMPLDEARLIEWKIWLAFWARAVADPEIAAMQRSCVKRARAGILEVLRRLEGAGELAPGLDVAAEARRTLSLVMGMAVQVMFDANDWPAERQRDQLEGEIGRLYRRGRGPDAALAADAVDSQAQRLVR
jgi:AcrR family transcriptional regulator